VEGKIISMYDSSKLPIMSRDRYFSNTSPAFGRKEKPR
jgi:hypothetical protein